MDSKKLIPIILTIMLIIVALILYTGNNKKIDAYQTLNVKYQSKDYTFSSLTIDKKISFGKHDFFIISANGTELAFNTEEKIQIDKKEAEEVVIDKNEKIEVCFQDKSCATFSLK